jgi:branched-chain amino acid transport system substrate-binding protein
MVSRYCTAGAAAVFGLLLAGFPSRAAEPPYDIHVVLSLTGQASLYGQTVQQGLQLAEKTIAREGGINGRPVHFVFHDDETSAQVAVQLATRLFADKPPVILGSILVGQCMAMAPLTKEAGPVMYCLSPAINPDPGSYVFVASSSAEDISESMIRYFHKRGWDRFATITTTDASGQKSEKTFEEVLAKPEFKDMKIVERARFHPGDVSVAAQIESIRAAKPQALLAFTAGAATGNVFKAIVQSGFEIPVGTSAANELYSLMKQYESILPKELYLASGQGSALGEGLKLDPARIAARKKFTDALQEVGLKPDYGSEAAWDPAMIVVDALRHTMPDTSAAKVRDYMMHLKNYPGASGTYDFEKLPQRGIAFGSTVIVRWNAAKSIFQVASQPGGDPIAQE